jgi:hypothetical protein
LRTTTFVVVNVVAIVRWELEDAVELVLCLVSPFGVIKTVIHAAENRGVESISELN